MKKILLLGGSSQQIVAIEAAKKLGLYTVLCDYLPDNPGQFHSDKFYLISTTDKQAVFDVAVKEKIDYVIAYASDPAAPTAAHVAEKLGLPTNPYAAVDTLCNKDKFRNFLLSHGFNAPLSKGYATKEEAVRGVNDFTFPVIVKPVDSSGSKGATVLKNADGIDRAVDFAFSFSRCHRIIIEEFIEKKHPYLVGGDVFVSDGKIVQWGLMNCHRDNSVNPLVPVGKSYPLLLDEKDTRAVKDTLQAIVSGLGIKFGPMNVELIVDKNDRVFPIDIGPRSGGNMIPDLLGMIFDFDMANLCVRAAMGEKIASMEQTADLYYSTLNLHSDRDGVFEDVLFSRDIEKYIVRKNIYKKRGDPVEYFSNASNALGIVFFKFEDLQTMIETEDRMNEYVKIVLKGDEI